MLRVAANARAHPAGLAAGAPLLPTTFRLELSNETRGLMPSLLRLGPGGVLEQVGRGARATAEIGRWRSLAVPAAHHADTLCFEIAGAGSEPMAIRGTLVLLAGRRRLCGCFEATWSDLEGAPIQRASGLIRGQALPAPAAPL
ncbi:MAG TPA: hypothetical protein VF017_23395 [Thermoanaerobaculia bacterium]|nr:hypothetical protein [Thermoanaerobaculia bacterium]